VAGRQITDLLPGQPRRPSRTVRLAARGLAVGRVAVGTAFVAAPDTATRAWLGTRSEDDPGREVAVRALGARDVVLGIGLLVSLRRGTEKRQAARWVEAAIVADLADAASTVVAEDLDASPTVPLAVALGAAAIGGLVRTGLR
jgi:hypothetical protein